MPSPELLADRGERAAIVNGEMGCGKTTVGIATARRAARRRLPPHPGAIAAHLVYKWHREIQETVAGAKVWVLNGLDTLVKLIATARAVGRAGARPGVLRARARADAHGFPLEARLQRAAHATRRCGRMPGLRQVITNLDGEPINPVELKPRTTAAGYGSHCATAVDADATRSLSASDQSTPSSKALQRIPTIGKSPRAEADASS